MTTKKQWALYFAMSIAINLSLLWLWGKYVTPAIREVANAFVGIKQ